ncbi:aminopeptidase P family protein [Mycoplasmatota bacterium WC44]
MNNNNFINNREKLFERICDNSLVVMFAGIEKHKTADQYFDFEPNRNFFYLTGISRDNMVLVMRKGEKNETYLFIEENTELKAKWDGARMSKEEASELSGIEVKNIRYLEAFDNFFQAMMGVSRLGSKPAEFLHLDILRSKGNEHQETFEFSRKVKDLYPELQVKNVNIELGYLRMFKSDAEVEEIQKAVDFTNEGILNLMRNAEPGLYEYQIESFYKQSLMFNNTTESFQTIAASGVNATTLHYVDNNAKVEDNTLCLFDLGSISNNYCSDITRTFPANGKFTDRQRAIYEIVLKANKESINYVKPGVTWTEINKFAKDILIKGLKDLGIIKEDSEISKYYYHGLGHFLGLDVHDVGIYSEPLSEGMVLTIEPGLYIAEEKIGIRIEDDILVTKDGFVNLSADIIKEVHDIEEFMQNKTL